MKNRELYPLFATQTFRWILVAVTTAAGALWLLLMGSVPVIRGSTALDTAVPFWYMLTAFPVLGMLVADILTFLASPQSRLCWIELTIQVVILVLISSLRLSLKLPISGHSLLFSYFILRRAIIGIPRHRTRSIELAIAVGLFFAISYVKLFWWDDFVTLLSGVGIGVFMVLFSYIIIGRSKDIEMR